MVEHLAWLLVLATLRGVFCLVEQPKGSLLVKMECIAQAFETCGMKRHLTYFGAFNSLFAEGAIAPKEARLAAVSASAAIRCEYCITAQVHLAKQAGATEDEIKSAIQIAAEVARFSILLYGNEFGQDELKTILKIED